MARLEVIQIRCDRCKRVELIPKQDKKDRPDFEARLGDKHLVFDDLCNRCKQAVDNAWRDLEEWEREIKQVFGPTIPNNQAAPLQTAPDYSPPKPHSGGKHG